uniref:C-type lectin domain-containing protein n=1 Tax=Romanomermis culicivorax TaxID=13658 RepID=A0A915L1Q7_ROMCU
LHFRTLTFPAITFCATNPFKASQVGQSPEIDGLLQDLEQSLYGSSNANDTSVAPFTSTIESSSDDSHSRKKRQIAVGCPNDYFRLEGGCYMKANLTTNWHTAYNVCKAYGADLPIFTNFSNYRAFFNWRNKPVSGEDSTCKLQGFQMSANAPSILCNNSLTNVKSWWCIADHPEYSAVSSAVQADSCFCLFFNSSSETMSFDNANRGCESMNGTLVDYRSQSEVDMIYQLISNFNATDGDLMNAALKEQI